MLLLLSPQHYSQPISQSSSDVQYVKETALIKGKKVDEQRRIVENILTIPAHSQHYESH